LSSQQHTTPDTPRQDTLSVAIITQNEEANLARTLASVRFADEVIVVDSGSTDRTVAIAQEAGCRVFTEPWQGFARQKNLAIGKCSSTWILSLDADEELSPELQQEMRALLKSSPPNMAFRLRRRNLFLGRWMRHGGYYPDAKLRLFRRAGAHGVAPLRFAERAVHETIAYDGPTETLRHDLIHHAYPTLHGYLEHMNRYSTLGAQVAVKRGKATQSWWAFLGNIILVPVFTFLWNYIFRGGFLDGREGFLLHTYHSLYTSWKYAKAWEMTRKS
jgi:glycosyltransferase involved in cell wall biosynthesis